MISYWEKAFFFKNYDYIIIGSGIVGLTTSIFIKQNKPEKKILLIDRGFLPEGASTKNAGFACFGTIGEILDDLKQVDERAIVNTIRARWEGLESLKKLVSPQAMHYQKTGGYEVFTNKEDFEFCAHQIEYVNQLMIDAGFQTNLFKTTSIDQFKDLYHQVIFNPLEAQLNPALMIRFLIDKATAMGVDIQMGFKVEHFEKRENHFVIFTDKNIDIRSEQLILCTNAFTSKLLEAEDIIPSRNQVLVSEPLLDLKINATYHFDRGYVYFRNIGNRLLIGGARNLDPEEEQTDQFGSNDQIKRYLQDFATRYILGHPWIVDHSWSGIIATGHSKNPIVKEVDSGLFMGARLGGMGVAIGTEVGKQLASLVIGENILD